MWRCSPSRPAATTTANAKSMRSSGKAAGCTSTLEPVGIPAPKPHQVDRTLNSQRPRPQPRTLAELDGLERWGVVELAAPLGGTLPAVVAFAVAALAGALDLGGGPLQAGADLLGLQFGDRALVALGGLPAALAQPPGDHDPVALGEGVGEVLGLAAPDVDLEERGVAVAPLAVLLDALGDGHPQVGDGGAVVGEADLGVVDQVADDDGVVVCCHRCCSSLVLLLAGGG